MRDLAGADDAGTAWFLCERSANAFPGVEGWNLQAAFHLIGHDAVDYFRIALCVDEELADTALPSPDVGK
jgi:hypothetical protein